MRAGYGLICAINKITATAGLALSAVSAKKSYTDALADFPTGDPLAYGLNFSDHLVARHSRKCNAWQESIHGGGVRVANAAGLNTDAHLAGGWFDQRTIYEFKLSWV
jgi:hypothetical protein